MESQSQHRQGTATEQTVIIPAEGAILEGILAVPTGPKGIVLVLSSEPDSKSLLVRARPLLGSLFRAGFGTLLVSLLVGDETSGRPLVETGPLNDRIAAVAGWLAEQPEMRDLPVGCYATEAVAAAALQVSLSYPQLRAFVSRGGRLDLAFNSLPDVKVPTLLLANQENDEAIATGQTAYNMLRSPRKFVIVKGSADRPRDPLEVQDEVVQLALGWFQQHLSGAEA